MFEVIAATEALEISLECKDESEAELIDSTLAKLDDMIRSAAEGGLTEIKFSWHDLAGQVHYLSHSDKLTDEKYTRSVRFQVRRALENKGYNVIFSGVGSVSVIVRWGGIEP